MRTAILVLAVAACSDLPPYQAECGNGIIDEHEDCDSPTGCLACSLPCQPDGSCGSDATGYVCGGDGICHAPGGAFKSEPQSLAFNARDLFVTDVNGDRVGDVIGVSPTSLLVNRGILYSGPGPQQVIPTPFLTGTPAITTFDGDQTTDVVLPTAQSIVAYTSPLQELAPYPFAIDVSYQNAVPLDLFQFDAINIGLIGAHPNNSQLFYVTIDISLGRPNFVNSTPICSNIPASQFESMDVHDASSSSMIEKVVAISGGGGGCVIKVTSPIGSGPPPAGTATELVQIPARNHLVLADVTPGDLCPDVIDGLTSYATTGAPGSCGISASNPTDLRALMSASMLAPAVDEIAIGTVALAPYYIAGAAPEALATSYGIYAIGSPVTRIYHSDRSLDHVLSLDIDGDGDLDVAATSANGFDDIDFLYRFHPPAPSSDGFQLVRYDTDAYPHKLFAADFDGNHVADLAYTERLPFGERLMVAYGTTDRPLAPIEMSVFRNVIEMTPGFVNTSDPSGTLSDLTVLDYDAATARPLLTLLHGSPDRTLVPNFDPRTQGPMGGGPVPSAQPSFTAVVAGHFGGDGAIDDLFSVVADDTGLVGYLAQSTLGAFMLGGSTKTTYPDLVSCGDSQAGLLCADSAHYLAWPVGDHDAILAVEDIFGRAVTIDPQHGTVTADPQFEGLFAFAVHSMRSVDVDQDGTPELVVSFGVPVNARATSGAGSVLRCPVDAAGTIGTCDDLSGTISDKDGPAICVDAAPGLVGRYQRGEGKPFPKPELVMACHRPMVSRTDIFRIASDGTGLHAVPLLQLTNNTTVERIFLGDVNGDGVDDLLALDVDPSTLVPMLLVYSQCSSRDTGPGCL
jgi:hypothetical protein